MSARQKGTRKRQPGPPNTTTPSTESPATPPRQRFTASAALDECVGAICLVEVTLHSLEFQETASPEQEVLKRALKAIWIVHDWIDGRRPNDLDGEGADLEDDEP